MDLAMWESKKMVLVKALEKLLMSMEAFMMGNG